MLELCYLLFNVMIFVSAAVMLYHPEMKGSIKVRPLLWAYMLVSVPYIWWDMWAVSAGHWDFNPVFILGTYLGNLAVEEVLFFFTVPLVGLLMFKAISTKTKKKTKGYLPLYTVAAIGALGAFSAILWWDNGYTRTVSLALVLTTSLLVHEKKLMFKQSFWIFQGVLLLTFFAANTYLTALPIITYGSDAIIGTRIVTIPLEDFAYNFSLINLFLLCYVYFDKKKI